MRNLLKVIWIFGWDNQFLLSVYQHNIMVKIKKILLIEPNLFLSERNFFSDRVSKKCASGLKKLFSE